LQCHTLLDKPRANAPAAPLPEGFRIGQVFGDLDETQIDLADYTVETAHIIGEGSKLLATDYL
jgi:hypothetical protein